jgi:hypothetical protein
MNKRRGFPRSCTCEQCGEIATVIAWIPKERITNPLTGFDESKTNLLNCSIECPKCGRRSQQIEYYFR